MPSTKAIVENLLSGSDICYLCLNQIGNDRFIRMDDEVLSANHKDSMFFVDMLSSMMNKDMILLSTITTEVCEICAQSVIDYYHFVNACQENAARLTNILNNLTETFTQSTFNSKAVILSMESNSLQCELYLESKPLCDRSSVLNRLRKKKEIKAQKKVINIYENYENFADNNDYQCKSCLKLFSCTKALRAHIKRIHAPKDYNCDVCYKKYGYKHLLINHKKSTHYNIFVICSECGKSYNNLSSLKKHEATHNIHLNCQNCGKLYRSKKYYQQHVKSKACSNNKFRFKTLLSEEKLKCTLCDKGFVNKSGLKTHVRSFHDVEAALTCLVCSKPFSFQSQLTEHMVKHTKEKKFECNICGGKFVSKPSLLYHTRTHTGETPFACPQCPMRFLSASRRLYHMRQFHWEPMLECVHCNTKFKTHGALSKHKKRHLNPNSRIYIQNNAEDSSS